MSFVVAVAVTYVDAAGQHLADHAHEILHGHALLTGEHQMAVRVALVEDLHAQLRRIGDVDVLAHRVFAPGVIDAFFTQRLAEEAVNAVALVGPPPVERAVTHDGEGDAVTLVIALDEALRRLLARAVERTRFGIDVDRAGEHEAARTRRAGGFECVDVADHVHVRGIERPVARFVDVGNAGEVVHVGAAFGRAPDRCLVEQVADDALLVSAEVRRRRAVEYAYSITGFGERVRDVASEEAAAAQHERGLGGRGAFGHGIDAAATAPRSTSASKRLRAASSSMIARASSAYEPMCAVIVTCGSVHSGPE